MMMIMIACMISTESLLILVYFPGRPSKTGVEEAGYKDWMFMNYTFKRFEGLSLRGARPKASSVLGLGRSTSEQAPAREWL